ncbi:MAG: valine--tRNA ligase [Candidatus Omnitrophica bacterium 4484_49]|nr:MAG: valine--tRNA ligase [Candidatus Omnitrophica bacterium 4484_49]
MESRYNPRQVEEKWYRFWEENEFFHVQPDSGKQPYCIVIPPPNVTGILHMGHALNNTIQDILIRWKRMQGYCTLWIPGTDHAGIATQNVVERQLAKEGLSREDLGREKFLQRVWEWKEKYGSTIVNQLRKLGASCDWRRERFTMDDGLSEAVITAFIQLFNRGLIYRGNYIINWCPRCKTALADEEVEYQEQEGFLYYLKYPVIGEKRKFVTVATTRPETMLGDVAVAVHPDDERYEFLKDKKLLLPLMKRELVIVKDEIVDPEFGTGAVKVTPAHDPADFEIALRHKLKPVIVMDQAGKMNENAGKYKGLDRFEARKQIIKDLESQELVEKIEPYIHSVGHCYRCNTVIEPYISRQWFVKMRPLAKPAIKVVKDGKIKFYPPRWEKVYLHWMENIKDWCISRQIWWGHRIPVYYCRNCWREESEYDFTPKDVNSLKGVIVSAVKPERCPECGGNDFIQDEDVLDTWFSSWLWPFSTMGWPKIKKRSPHSIKEGEKLNDLDYFYPTSTLVTAQEILFFWVARMIMAGMEFIGEEPFRDVYIHGTVRDEKGRKMSKSLGNIIDPLEIIQEYGADALRFSLISITAMGQDVYLSRDKFISGRNFTNKIWNAARFLIMNIGELKEIRIDRVSVFDAWILTVLNQLITDVNQSLSEYNFNESASLLYEFFWHKFCDWYIEIKKKDLYSGDELKSTQAKIILIYILDNILRLLHPFMPFITEEIWQKIKPFLPLAYSSLGKEYRDFPTIMIATWPEVDDRIHDPRSVELMSRVIEIIQAIRNIRAELNVPPAKKINVILAGEDGEILDLFDRNREYIMPLATLDDIEIHRQDIERPDGSAFGTAGRVNIYLLLQGIIDIQKEKQRLRDKREKFYQDLENVVAKLENKEFIAKANPQVVAKVRERKKELEGAIQELNSILDSL